MTHFTDTEAAAMLAAIAAKMAGRPATVVRTDELDAYSVPADGLTMGQRAQVAAIAREVTARMLRSLGYINPEGEAAIKIDGGTRMSISEWADTHRKLDGEGR